MKADNIEESTTLEIEKRHWKVTDHWKIFKNRLRNRIEKNIVDETLQSYITFNHVFLNKLNFTFDGLAHELAQDA
jgi:hypothetical protein